MRVARGGGRIESYYARGMLEIRPTLHLAYRLTLRANQVLQSTGAAAEGAGLWRVALPAFVVLDVAIWHVLRRSDRFGLRWRLPLDMLDAAFWILSPLPTTGQADLAVFVAVPLAVEAGVRMGWRALTVPAGILVSTTAAGALVGRPVQILGVTWTVLGAVVGMGFFRYCRHLDGRAEGERRRFLAAARRRAYLAGQNDVGMGASSAVDAIEGLVPVLGRPPSGSALWRLADGWKTQLSTSTAQEAKYLQVALLEWERQHNAHPDLSGLVRLHVPEGQGTTLLSVAQVLQLQRALDRLPMRGVVTVRLEDADQPRLPGQQLRLQVADHHVVVPADRRESPSPLDPAAVAYYYVAVLAAAWVSTPLGGVSVGLTVAGVATCVVAGSVSHQVAVTRGRRARLGIYVGAVGVSLVLTLLCGRPRIPFRPDGVANLGFGNALILLTFLGGYYWDSLRRWRWLVPAGIAANVLVGFLIFPGASTVSLRFLLAAVLFNMFPFFPCRHLSRALEAAAAEHARALQAVDEDAERAAFLEGRESVIGLVRQAREDAMAQLRALRPQLEPGLAELAVRRLEQVDQRLLALSR